MSVLEQVRDYATSVHCALKEGEPLSAYTSFRIGGPAEMMLFPDSVQMLQKIIAFCHSLPVRPFILGKGSNLLIDDAGMPGVTICTERMRGCTRTGETEICCDAGVSLVKLCLFALEHGLAGLEFAYGIPGSVGGAVFMNAGAYGGEIRDVVRSAASVEADGALRNRAAAQLDFGYRHSVFQHSGEVIASAVFQLHPGEPAQIREKMDDILARRKDKQPLQYPSAGSAFKRPDGYFAGALIEQCGLKGFAVGGAQVSEKHAGFIINRGGASAADVLRLIDHIRAVVYKQTGVLLEPEVRCISAESR